MANEAASEVVISLDAIPTMVREDGVITRKGEAFVVTGRVAAVREAHMYKGSMLPASFKVQIGAREAKASFEAPITKAQKGFGHGAKISVSCKGLKKSKDDESGWTNVRPDGKIAIAVLAEATADWAPGHAAAPEVDVEVSDLA